MARSIPFSCPEIPAAEAGDGEKQQRTYSIHLVTPLFGGGCKSGANDPVTLIRGASVRGLLRFWWRASRGASLRTVDELRHQEERIWGAADKPSPVSVQIKAIQHVEQKSVGQWLARNGLSYALFPFKEAKETAQVATRASFQLFLRWPEQEDIGVDLDAAVWAWVNFGGLGARTRRGCGALFCKELAPWKGDGIRAWYKRKQREYGLHTAQDPGEWPTLPAADGLLIKRAEKKPEAVWEEVVNLLREFRQGKGTGRNPGTGNRPGRSWWPEADSLRRITGRGNPKHGLSITTREDAFPRAEFGLPIVFQFRDEQALNCELYPAQGSNRMASPLILKPLALSRDRALPLIVRLRTKALAEIELRKPQDSLRLSAQHIRRPELSAYANSPMKERSSAGSALEAFAQFATERGFG